ncbi:MAG: DUF3301 domain-containing protein [Gammaproteobacteria bacterium]|nr:DUF3301 domain-containing protein [Gammaproteobacteria bacterium]
MVFGSLPLLILLVLGIGLWLDGARARELASGLAPQLCAREGVQFLDGSAALESWSLSRTPRGVRIRRSFSFSYFSEEQGRRQGYITLVGAQITAFELQGQTTLEG